MKNISKSKILLLLFLICTIFLASCAKTPEELYKEQYDLGIRYLSEGNYEEAIIAFEAAIEIDAKSTDAYVSLASVYAQSGNAQSALDVINNAANATGADITDQTINALIEQGKAQLEAGRDDLAENMFNTAVSFDNTRLETYEKIADAYVAAGDGEKALQFLYDAKQYVPEGALDDKIDEIIRATDYVVEWVEPIIENAARTYLNKPSGNIYRSELVDIACIAVMGDTYAMVDKDFQFMINRIYTANYVTDTGELLSLYGVDNTPYYERGRVQSIADLNHFVNLSSATVVANQISDISSLENHVNSKELEKYCDFFANYITDEALIEKYTQPTSNSDIQTGYIQFINVGESVFDYQ